MPIRTSARKKNKESALPPEIAAPQPLSRDEGLGRFGAVLRKTGPKRLNLTHLPGLSPDRPEE